MTPRDVDRLSEHLEDLFADLWQVPRFTGLRRGFRPAVDAYRTEDPPTLTVVIELAGVDPDTVSVTAASGALVIQGERLRPRAPGRTYQLMEIDVGAFERRVALPEEVDTESASASYEAGLLTIVLPLAPRRGGPVRVSVQGRQP
jgi:HSP20 family protein